MVYKLFDKKASSANTSATCAWSETLARRNKFASGVFKRKIMSDQELAEQLHKRIIRKFEKRKVQSFLYSIFWGADLADM